MIKQEYQEESSLQQQSTQVSSPPKKQQKPQVIQNRCAQCKKTFKDKFELKTHVKKAHPQKKGFPCSICQLFLSSQKMLNQHVKIIHSSTPFKIASSTSIQDETTNQNSPSFLTTADDSNLQQQSNSSVDSQATLKISNNNQQNVYQNLIIPQQQQNILNQQQQPIFRQFNFNFPAAFDYCHFNNILYQQQQMNLVQQQQSVQQIQKQIEQSVKQEYQQQPQQQKQIEQCSYLEDLRKNYQPASFEVVSLKGGYPTQQENGKHVRQQTSNYALYCNKKLATASYRQVSQKPWKPFGSEEKLEKKVKI